MMTFNYMYYRCSNVRSHAIEKAVLPCGTVETAIYEIRISLYPERSALFDSQPLNCGYLQSTLLTISCSIDSLVTLRA